MNGGVVQPEQGFMAQPQHCASEDAHALNRAQFVPVSVRQRKKAWICLALSGFRALVLPWAADLLLHPG